jgi:hypothetical protein
VSKQQQKQQKLRQYILTGAALGLYFGLFFRPARSPNLVTVLWLSLLSALVLTLLRLRRPEARSLPALLRYGARAWLGFALALAVLEGRHPVYDVAGRVGVTIFTAAAGAVAGWWYARRAGEERS